MGEFREKAKVRNFIDAAKFAEGLIDEDSIREVEAEAVVDTGASHMCLPPGVIEELGLLYSHTFQVATANGTVERRIFTGAEITIKGRTVQMEVMEGDDETPPLIGYLVLEALDFVVDPTTAHIIGNPEHGGKWVAVMYRTEESNNTSSNINWKDIVWHG